MNSDDNKRIVASFFAAGNRGDMDACLALLADDIRWTNMGSTRFSGTFEGKQAVLEDLLGPLFGQLRNGIASEVDDMIAEGDRVVVLSRGTAETVDGKPYNNRYCQIMQLRNGLIVAVTEYMDTALVDEAFGRR
jgi:ketosteroid isomerase-like protein